jgi:hypothetical protein
MEFVSGNVFIRKMEGQDGFAAGHVTGGHTHNFDHTTILFSGRWHVKKWLPAVKADGSPVLTDGQPVWLLVHDNEIEGPWHLLIEAKAKHEFTFLGFTVPDWMEPYLNQLPYEAAIAFREQYMKSVGRGWCIYAHRTPQGDVSQTSTGWGPAYV